MIAKISIYFVLTFSICLLAPLSQASTITTLKYVNTDPVTAATSKCTDVSTLYVNSTTGVMTQCGSTGSYGPVSIDLSITQIVVAPKDTLVVTLTADAYQGDPHVSISIDGTVLTASQSITTARCGAYNVANTCKGQDFTYTGYWGAPGPHTAKVTFLDDAYGGTPATDRNAYVNGITYNGTYYPNAIAALTSTGQSLSFSVGTAAPAPGQATNPPPVVVVTPPDTTTPVPPTTTAGVTPGLVTPQPSGFKNAIADCGAKGDGSTDDTAKIQACVTTYQKVWFPNANYKINGVVYTVSNSEMVGQSLSARFVSTPGTTHVFWLPKTAPAQNVSIHGFTFDGAGIAGDTVAQTGIKINENRFQNFNAPSVGAGKATWVANNHGIYIDAMVHNSDFSHNDFLNNMPSDGSASNVDGDGSFPRSGIWLFGYDQVTADWNHFTNVYEGIKLCQGVPNKTAPVGRNIDVSHNVFDPVHRMSIEIQSNDGCGRGDYTGWTNTDGLRISYNSIASDSNQYWGSFGISLANPPTANVEIDHNLINFKAYPAANRGLGIEAGGRPFNIHHNVASGPWGLGIGFFAGSSGYNQVHDNWFCNRNPQMGPMKFDNEQPQYQLVNPVQTNNTILQSCPATLPDVPK